MFCVGFTLTTCKEIVRRMETSHTCEDRQNQGTIQMPTFATKPLTTSSAMPWKYRRTTRSDSKNSKCRNCNSTFSTAVLGVENSIQTQVTTSSDFPSDAMSWIKEVEMVHSFDELQFLTIRAWKGFSSLRCWTQKLSLFCKRTYRIPTSRRRSVSRTRKPRKRTVFYKESRSPS